MLKKPPVVLEELLNPVGGKSSKNYKAQIRICNSMFSMTSMGGNVGKKINDGRGPYIFRLNG
jgi:hypothetical protein